MNLETERRDPAGLRSILPRHFKLLVLVTMLGLLGAGGWFYFSQKKTMRQDAEEELQAIASLKLRQITDWREDELAEGEKLAANPFFIAGVAQWLAHPTPELANDILATFRSLRANCGYRDIQLVDKDGVVRLSLQGRLHPLLAETAQGFARALRDGKPVITDLHVDEDLVPHLDIIAPFYAYKNSVTNLLGAAVLQCDLEHLFFPLINSWPTSSGTGETFLVRRDGDSVLYLNELRHRPNSALKFRLALTQTNLPAVKGLLGQEGVVDGVDYRGIPVLAVISRVPDSPWIMVTKRDASETFASWHSQSLLILAVLAILIISVGITGLAIWQQHRQNYFHALYQAEARRGESEARFRSIFENMLNGLAHCQMHFENGEPRDFTYLATNPAFERLTGLKNVVGRKVSDVLPGIREQDPELFEIYGRVTRTGVPEHFERYVAALHMWVAGSVYSPTRGFFTVIFDVITERKEAESALTRKHQELHDTVQQLLQSQSMLQLIIESIPVRVFWKDRNLRYLGCNSLFARDAGFAFPHQLAGKDDFALSWRDQAERYRNDDRQVIDGLRPKIDIIEPETTSRGNTIWLKTSKVPLPQPNGEILGVLGVYEDITEHLRIESRLRQQAALLDAANDAIYVLDLDNTVTYWNQGAERLYGWTGAEACGRKITDLGEVEPVSFAAAQSELMESGSWSGELKQTGKSAKWVDIFCRWTLLRDEHGHPKEILAIHTDITERKQLEANFLRAQRQENIGSLAGGIAHDLNNILAPILMTAPLVRESITDPDNIEMLQTMEACAQRGADIIRQLLTFARGTPGSRVPTPARHLLNEMEKIIRETFPRNLCPVVAAPKDLWPIMGDPTQIHQALMNLCVNARDAMPDGGTLTLTAANRTLDELFVASIHEAKAGDYLCLSVADTGTGISPENLDRIFDPFFTTKEIGKGTGLGLASVLGIVRGHGGFVHVNSRVGSGTIFELYFPAVRSLHSGAAATGSPAPTRGRGERILVVDDEASVRRAVQRTLQAHGYETLQAAEGNEALTLFKQHRAEIKGVLTDMMMPGMEGPRLIQALRGLDPQLPILGMSGLADRIGVKGLGEMDTAVLLNKPFTTDQLLKALHQSLAPGSEGVST